MEKLRQKLALRMSFLRGKRGMTMVNVIVAFVVLLMMFAMFIGIVKLSQNMISRADVLRTQTAEMMKKYYLGEMAAEPLEEMEYSMESDGESFTFKTTVYSYSDGDFELYSFGEHTD